MEKLGGSKSWVAAAGVALLMAFVVVPALSGAASAVTPSSGVPAATDTQWAYGGEGWSNGTLTLGNSTITWDAMFGWTVVFTATPSDAPNVTTLEEQRTVGVTIGASLTNPVRTVNYHYHAQEVDTAFANLTNASVVYVNGMAVPALGILNASASVQGLIDQSVSETVHAAVSDPTRSASLSVTASADSSVSFTPSLGLIPLNLTGVSEWNSSAAANPAASWQIAWTWNDQAFNGTTASGSGSSSGGLSASGQVNLTGQKVPVDHPFSDHQARVGVVLVLQGPFDAYDGFILIPHAFDLFGGAAHGYDAVSLGSAAISAETLYLSSGPRGLELTAADQTFGSDDASVNAFASTYSGPAAGASSPGATVEGQPMSVSQAQAEAYGLTHPESSVSSAGNGALLAALLIGAIAVVLGTVGVIEWRSYARRKSQKQLVGGYGEGWTNGVPPAHALPPSVTGPTGPNQGPAPADDPNRRL